MTVMQIPLLDHTAATLDENLALDEALLLAAEAGESGEVLRFWEWPNLAVVLGAGGSIAIDVNEEACRRDGVTIHRRASGGGTVILGPGCLNFTLVLCYDRDPELRFVNSSYRWILNRICNVLRTVGRVEFAGISDLAINGMKVSGNAQQRKTRFLLHHGTLLYGFDLGQIGRYLLPPERRPDYRGERDHSTFVANLTVDPVQIRDLLATEFAAERADAPAGVAAKISTLVEERYGRPDWVRRR
jgi:lipoate-protein ligase A